MDVVEPICGYEPDPFGLSIPLLGAKRTSSGPLVRVPFACSTIPNAYFVTVVTREWRAWA